MSRERKLAKNTMILAMGTFLPKLASFITLPILTGYLTQQEYGTYDLITILVSFILPVATLQIQTAAFRFLIDCKKDSREVKAIVTNIVAFIFPMSFLALCILFFCLPAKSAGVKLWICIYFFADIIVNCARQVTRGLALNFHYSVSAMVSAAGKLLFLILFVKHFKWGLSGAVIALCMASLLSLLYLVVRVKLYRYIALSTLNMSMIKKMLSYSWAMVPNSMSMSIMTVSDRFVVTLFMGASANAVYAVANKIPSLLTLAQTTYTMAWQESASIASKDDDADAYYSNMFRTIYDLVAGFLGLLIAVTPILFALLIRGDYGKAYFQMPILFMAMFFYSMSAYLGGIYVAYKATRSVGITTVTAAVCNLLVDLLFIQWIGLYAASGSTLVSYIILFVVRLFNVRRYVKLQFNCNHMLLVLGIMLIECILCFQRKTILDILNILIGIAVFCALNKSLIGSVWNIMKTRILKGRKK